MGSKRNKRHQRHQQKTELSVGDRVRIVEPDARGQQGIGASVRVGESGQITEIFTDKAIIHPYEVTFEDGRTLPFNVAELEPFSAEQAVDETVSLAEELRAEFETVNVGQHVRDELTKVAAGDALDRIFAAIQEVDEDDELEQALDDEELDVLVEFEDPTSEMLDTAWAIICNVTGDQPEAWNEAVSSFRDAYHELLNLRAIEDEIDMAETLENALASMMQEDTAEAEPTHHYHYDITLHGLGADVTSTELAARSQFEVEGSELQGEHFADVLASMVDHMAASLGYGTVDEVVVKLALVHPLAPQADEDELREGLLANLSPKSRDAYEQMLKAAGHAPEGE